MKLFYPWLFLLKDAPILMTEMRYSKFVWERQFQKIETVYGTYRRIFSQQKNCSFDV